MSALIKQQRILVSRLEAEFEKARQQLEAGRSELRRLEATCPHQWSQPISAHIRHEGYTIPGDPPGTMGVDWRGPTDVPPRTEERWKRVCDVCGKEEFTSQTTSQTVRTPKF